MESAEMKRLKRLAELVDAYFKALDKAREIKQRAGAMGLDAGHGRALDEAETALRLEMQNRMSE